MQASCAVCGKSFEARRAAAKYCGERCRKRAQRKPDDVRDPETEGAPEEGGFPIGLLASTLAELAKAGRENTPQGQAALLLAYRLERSQGDTGASVAALVKQLETTLADALKSAEKTSAVDALKKRRDDKRAG